VVSERYVEPGVRFVPLEGDQPATATAALTRRDTGHLPTAAFVRALSRAGKSQASRPGATDLTTSA
jgi:hypothetical protein